ncbi:hypothetical protein Pmani_027748 [Petrolisthes manimaculis]|uniref:Uncharacterized protein n=1 Tax=Petrolisthes manimaculis TaxID=1843537 RepID=A0AAE1P216_9EUCA|nr:hypothetical protein Pmani_027748 [Petrolisthes manimaculis]
MTVTFDRSSGAICAASAAAAAAPLLPLEGWAGPWGETGEEGDVRTERQGGRTTEVESDSLSVGDMLFRGVYSLIS